MRRAFAALLLLWGAPVCAASPWPVALTLAPAFFLDEAVSQRLADPQDPDPLLRLGNAWGRELGVAATGGMWLGGHLLHRPAWSEDAQTMAMAGAVGLSVTWGLKRLGGRLRPDAFAPGGEDAGRWFAGGDAFPSGHTTLAFALSTAWAQVRPRPSWQRTAAYALAAGTALARIRYRRHWLSDTVAGAWVGWYAARWSLRHRGGGWRFSPLGVAWQGRW